MSLATWPHDVPKVIQRLLNATDPLPSLAGKCLTGGRLNLKKALNPRGNANWLVKATRLWLARRDLISHLFLFGKQFASVGRVSDFFPSEERARFLDADSELGPNHDGYRVAGDAMSAERAAIFQQRLAQEVSEARPKFLDPATDEAYRTAASQIRQAGAAPVFVVAPILTQTVARFRQTPPAPLLSFNDSRKYPEFYDTKVRIDDAHLTREGAEQFTRLLAQEFARQARQP